MIEVSFQVPLEALAKEIPKTLMVYRLAPDPAGAAQSKALRAIWGAKTHLELHQASGGVFAGDMGRLWAKAPKFGEAPAWDERRARTGAETFLRQIKGLPQEKVKVTASTDTAELKDRQGKKQSLPIASQVTYRRILNGYEVLGPGGKIKVFQERDGKVVGYLRVWRQLTPEKEMPLVTLAQAAEKFRQSPLGDVLLADVVKVEVKAIKLAYLERGAAEPQNYLQPVFLFQCLAHLKGQERLEQVPFSRYLAALAEPPEPLFPKGREFRGQERPKELPTPEKEKEQQ